MAYNPYNAVNAIYKLKGQWDSANKTGDAAKKSEAAKRAQSYYNELRRNGFDAVADELTASDYAASKAINDYYAKTGRTATRPYFYTLGKSRGLSESDIDKLIGYDNTTGEITFGGKNIGKPDSVVDGTSYWGDTSVLDNAFNDYVNRTGLTRPKATAVNQENEKLFAKYNQEYDDLKNTNPFETDEAKTILAKYDLAGLQGRDNQVAKDAGDNGGNIDSFAAANALRQQTAIVNQGQQVVLDAHQQKLDHARALLSDMGVNIERVFNEDETVKNNQVSRDVATSEVTGTIPMSMLAKTPYYNQFFNEDGTLKNPDIDYKAEIQKADAAGNTELAKVLRAARGVKIYSDYGKYGKFADGDYTLPSAKPTEAARQFNEQIAQADRVLNAENAENAAERQNKLDQINAQTQGEKEIIRETAKYTTPESDEYAAYNVLLSMWPVNETEKRAFIEEFIKPIYEGKEAITPEGLKQLIVTNSEAYNIDVDDAQKICQAFDVSTDWLSQYRDRTDADGESSTGRSGNYGGMVKK